MIDDLSFCGIPFVFDDNVPRGVMLVFDANGDFEIFSVPLNPPPESGNVRAKEHET